VNKLYRLWLKLRKPTVVAHWLVGAICAAVFVRCWPAAAVLMLLFAMFEWWNDWCDRSRQGAMDWWDSLLIFFAGVAVAFILAELRVIAIRWWF